MARAIIARDRECQLQLQGCEGPATEADHVIGWADATAAGWDPADIDDPSNGQGLCRNCHRIKTLGEIERGRQRAAARRPRKRPQQQHPGMLT